MAAFVCGKLDINPKKLGEFTENSTDSPANNRRRNCGPVPGSVIIKLLKIQVLIFIQIFS